MKKKILHTQRVWKDNAINLSNIDWKNGNSHHSYDIRHTQWNLMMAISKNVKFKYWPKSVYKKLQQFWYTPMESNYCGCAL